MSQRAIFVAAMFGRRAAAVFGASLLALSVAATITLREARADDTVEAERSALYREARDLGAKGRWKEAQVKLRRVVQLRPAPKALIALAYAELQLGRLLDARSNYERARDAARSSQLADDLKAAEAGVNHVAPQIPKLELEFPSGEPPKVRVGIDGKLAPLRNGLVEVDPGEHVVVVAAEGYRSFHERVNVAKGERLEILVELETAPAGTGKEEPDILPTDTPAEPSSGPPIGAVVLGGAGILAAGVGVVTWANGNSSYQAVVDECGGDASRCPEARRLELEPKADDARAEVVRGQIFVLVGVGALAGAGIWWAVDASKKRSETSRLKLRTTVGNGHFDASFTAAF